MEMNEKNKARKMGEASRLGEANKTGERAKRRRRVQTALLAVALGFAPFAPLAAFAQTATSRAGTGFNRKFSVAGPVVESAPSEEKSAPTETASRAEFKAFLVGADKYDEAPQLPCVKNDVEAFAARLIEIGFDKNNVTVLKTGGKRRDDPTKANIEDRFEEFVESLEPGDFAVVFMSGHGLQNRETKEAFFAPVDLAPKKLFETAVSIDGMLARLEESSAKCRWMIVDACRNVPPSWATSEMRARAVDGARPGLTALIEVPDSTILLQSCEPGEVSYEGGEGSDHGLFTQSLLEALDANDLKADGNLDGVLKLTELFHYVAKRTNELAEQNGGTQNPTWSGATTDFEIFTTLIDGLPPERWREADAYYRDACKLRGQEKWSEALEQIKKARKINPDNAIYQAAEADIAAEIAELLDLQAQAKEERKAQNVDSPTASVVWPEAPAAGTQKSLEIKGASYNFQYCPADTFTMGSPASEAERSSWEERREVTLTQGFWMLETEVTQALWEAIMDENPTLVDDGKGPNRPVGNVSWEDCQKFIAKLNSAGCAPAGLKFRLPTEAEWEYACRAGTSGPYAGSSLDELGWYENNSGGKNHEVRKKAPNAWGLYDMHGNVWEWCADWFGASAYDTASQTDPTGPESGSGRVLRGGGWSYSAKSCRSASRNSFVPTSRYNDFGLRLVLGREL